MANSRPVASAQPCVAEPHASFALPAKQGLRTYAEVRTPSQTSKTSSPAPPLLTRRRSGRRRQLKAGPLAAKRLLDAKIYKAIEIVRLYNEAARRPSVVRPVRPGERARRRSQRFFFYEREGRRNLAGRFAQQGDPRPGDWIGGIRMKGKTLSGAQVRAIANDPSGSTPTSSAAIAKSRTGSSENASICSSGRQISLRRAAGNNDERHRCIIIILSKRTGQRPADQRLTTPTASANGARRISRASIAIPGVGVALPTRLDARGDAFQVEGAAADRDGRQTAQAVRRSARIVAQRHAHAMASHHASLFTGRSQRAAGPRGPTEMLEGHKTSIDPFAGRPDSATSSARRWGRTRPSPMSASSAGRNRPPQIDYILLSPDLRAAATNCGIDRSGQGRRSGAEGPAPALAASDHACLFVDLDLDQLELNAQFMIAKRWAQDSARQCLVAAQYDLNTA